MSYQTLYRKYRPSDLDDVAGQESIVKIVKNSLKSGRVSHAYLFCGPRGTGKTTMARILAKNVNCLDIHDGIACGKCKNCLSILSGNCPDIIELDAASNNGVDEIREIKNKVTLVPTELKYKVYVIDEVHMLSIGAFNALLKTLEEPPEHVIFILATTDLHKVPITIISRCQCLDFHRIREEEIVKRLQQIAKTENFDIEDGVLESIANLSDGGFRDAIGMLDKLVSYSDSKLTLSDFEDLNGIVSMNEKREFLKDVEIGNVKNIIDFVDKIYNKGKDLVIFSQDLMILCRNLIIEYYSYQKLDYDIEFLLKFVDILDTLSNDLKLTSNVRIIFETRILSFIHQNAIKQDSSSAIQNQLENTKGEPIINSSGNTSETTKSTTTVEKEIVQTNLSQKTVNLTPSTITIDNSDEERLIERNSIIINNCFCNASKQNLNFVKENWDKLNEFALDSKFGAIACYLSDSVVRAASDKEMIVTFDYESVVNRGLKFGNKVGELLNKIMNIPYYVAYLTVDQWNNERKKYIENLNQGNKYVYQELIDFNDSSDKIEDESKISSNDEEPESITDEAIKLFGEDLISVSE